MRLIHRVAATATLLSIMPVAITAAQSPSPSAPYDLAIAAGYKAAITCSAGLMAGRSEAQIAADELSGIYPEYDAIVPRLTATIDRAQGMVTVAYAKSMPPRIAIWRPGTGCTILPIGTIPARRTGPASAITPQPIPPNAALWPRGDSLPRIAYPPIDAVARAFDGSSYGKGKTTGIVIASGNKLLAERYAPGFDLFTMQRTWSVAKSITGTLVGLAVKQSAIDVAKPVPLAAWATPGDPRRTITLDNLLRMASGLHSDTAGNRTDAVYFGGTTAAEGTLHWPLEARPGTRFRYANNDILLAMQSLRSALGEAAYRDFPQRALFGRIGMAHTVAETDWQGNYISSSQVWTTARDLARFGLLYLNDGVWQGERLLPANWRRYVTTASGPQPDGDFGYGATFWLINKAPGVPADAFSANGNRGQYVVIVPSRNIVIVRRGEDPGGAGFDIAKFTADVLATVP